MTPPSPSRLRIPVWRRLTPHVLLWSVVAVSTLLGVTTFNAYGESWDEQPAFHYGEDAWEHYAAPAEYWETYAYLKGYGPAYLAPANSIAANMLPLFPEWSITDARHFVNHLTFQIATIALFYLCLRVMAAWPALVASLLFATQPLLFGHSFINPKDAPFMATFLLAAVLGFKLGDEREGARPESSGGLSRDWGNATALRKASLLGAAAIAALACFELLVLKAVVLPAARSLVAMAYAGGASPLLNQWFARLAQNAGRIPLEAYLEKTTVLYLWFRWPLAVLAAAPFVVLLARTFRSGIGEWRGSAACTLMFSLLGGAVAGLATATRVLGFSVLGLVALPIILGRRWSRVPLLVAYSASAAAVCYAAWPYLHGAPIERLWESLTVVSRYPWSGGVLFMGQILDPNALPWFYVPVLIGIQLTLPAILLATVGIGVGTLDALRTKRRRAEVAALIAWLAVPIAAVALTHSTLYGNFRQLLFITPPLFVFAGMTLDLLLSRLRSPMAHAAIAALVLAPGILGIAQLHPYEYVYYNRLVGGVRGAFRSYEMDYWCTSYREAMGWINEAAPAQAEIAVAPPELVAAHFARPDLRVFYAQEADDLVGRDPVLGLGCGRGNNDLGFFPDSPAVAEVVVDGARLAVVRDLRPLSGQTGE